jgi:hypothetical protein
VRARVGPAEIFFPLYAGLILLWPPVWAGDRFALPLYPLVFFYGAMALREVSRRVPALAGTLLTVGAFLLVLLPAARAWTDSTAEASACGRASRAGGAFACYGPQVEAFADAATWSGAALPSGSVVMSRKPRHFFLLSGLTSRTFPFSDEPDALLGLADAVGARYVLLDKWDGLATRYVGAAVRGRPGAFCFVRGFGSAESGGAQLLGIRPPDARADTSDPAADGGVRLSACPAEYALSDVPYSSSGSGRIPLLDGLGS